MTLNPGHSSTFLSAILLLGSSVTTLRAEGPRIDVDEIDIYSPWILRILDREDCEGQSTCRQACAYTHSHACWHAVRFSTILEKTQDPQVRIRYWGRRWKLLSTDAPLRCWEPRRVHPAGPAPLE